MGIPVPSHVLAPPVRKTGTLGTGGQTVAEPGVASSLHNSKHKEMGFIPVRGKAEMAFPTYWEQP